MSNQIKRQLRAAVVLAGGSGHGEPLHGEGAALDLHILLLLHSRMVLGGMGWETGMGNWENWDGNGMRNWDGMRNSEIGMGWEIEMG